MAQNHALRPRPRGLEKSSPHPRDLETPAPRPRDLEKSSPRPRGLEHTRPTRHSYMRPNFFLKAALLTFDDFKERFCRVHADLLENDGDEEGFNAFRGTSSAQDTSAQRDQHFSIRSKSSVSLTRSVAAVKRVAFTRNKLTKEPCLYGHDQFNVSSEELPEKNTEKFDVINSRDNHDGLNMSNAQPDIISNADQQDRIQSFGIEGDFKRRRNQSSKSVGELSLPPRDFVCRASPTCVSIDTAWRTLRRSESMTSWKPSPPLSSFTRKCLSATRYSRPGYEVCGSTCNMCNTSAVVDIESGYLKKADSDHGEPREEDCPQICSETSIIRMCVRAKRSEVYDAKVMPRHDLEENSEESSLASEYVGRSLDGSAIEEVELCDYDIADDTDRILALKAKDYGFNFEDICDITEPVNDTAESKDEEIDDLEHINGGRFSNLAINEMKMMIIKRKNQPLSQRFTFHGGFFNFLKPLKIIVRYFPVPPVNYITCANSPLDVFRNLDHYEIRQKNEQPDAEICARDDFNRQVSLSTLQRENGKPHGSFWMDEREWPLSSDVVIPSSDNNQEECDTSDRMESKSGQPLELSHNINSIGQLGNYVSGWDTLKRFKSEPSIGDVRKHKNRPQEPVCSLVAVPSRHISLRRCCEFVEPTPEVKKETKFIRMLGLPLIIYFGTYLGYPTDLIYFIDMFFGPDFTHLLYILSGLIIAYIYAQYLKFCQKKNNKQLGLNNI